MLLLWVIKACYIISICGCALCFWWCWFGWLIEIKFSMKTSALGFFYVVHAMGFWFALLFSGGLYVAMVA